ncbi:MAG: hypothetical protein ACR2N9_08320 [Acidimicrobiia bacterium]
MTTSGTPRRRISPIWHSRAPEGGSPAVPSNERGCRARSRCWSWLIVWPVLAIAVMIGNIAADADQWDADFLAMLLAGFAFVGFTEELVTRGVLSTEARGQYCEVWARTSNTSAVLRRGRGHSWP